MKINFTNDEYEKAKPDDRLKLECYKCGCIFTSTKKLITHELKRNKGEVKFCSKKCFYSNKNTKKEYKCINCSNVTFRREKEIRGNVFCSSSCAAKYNNAHKTYGTRRSKLEIWIEEQLKNKYNFEIIFNGKEAINSELDIYIPHLKLAFELNGIFHYEPIYGENKLENVKNNDNRKFQACLENKIEFCIIDTSGSKSFKPERDKKYLDIIENIINKKLTI